MRQKRALSFFYTLLLCIFAFSCTQGVNKLAFKSQRLLDEADILIERYDYKLAKDKIYKAQRNLALLVTEEPENIDFLLLQSRAYFSLFLTENSAVIQRAPKDPESLVRIPEPHQYLNYNTNLIPAKEDVMRVLNSKKKLTYQQEAAAYTTLASISRLNVNNLGEADRAYHRAISANLQWVESLEKEENKPILIGRIQNQIRNLQTSQVEVNLLAHKWSHSLAELEAIMGGSNLEYFDIHFDTLNQQLVEIEKKIYEEQQVRERDPRESKLLKFIKKRKQAKKSSLDQSYEMTSNEAKLLQTEIYLTDTKNNLIYRIICLYQLHDKKQLNQARQILRKHFPQIDYELIKQLSEPQQTSGVN